MPLTVALLTTLIFTFASGEQLLGFATNCISAGHQKCFLLGTNNLSVANQLGQPVTSIRHNLPIGLSDVYFDVFPLSANLYIVILASKTVPLKVVSYDVDREQFTPLSAGATNSYQIALINGSLSTAITGVSVTGRPDRLTLLVAVASEALDDPNDNCHNCPSVHKFDLTVDLPAETFSLTETGRHNDNVAGVDQLNPEDNVKSAQEIFAFSDNGYNYVIRNEFRPNRTIFNLQWTVYLTRICAEDKTDRLNSRVDLSLWCQSTNEVYQPASTETDNQGLFARSAQLQAQNLFVYFQPSDNTRLQRICRFSLDQIRSEFSRVEQMCRDASKFDPNPTVFFGKVLGSFIGIPCGQGVKEKKLIGQCSPNMTSTQAYMVQSHNPLNGELIATWKGVKAEEFLIYPEGIFITTAQNNEEMQLHKIPSSPRVVGNSEIFSSWSTSLPLSETRLIGERKLTQIGEYILSINGTRIVRIPLDCSLYDTCAKAVRSYQVDKLRCGWCATTNGSGVSLPQSKCSQYFFTSQCPPIVINITYSPGATNISAVTLHFQGDHFNTVEIQSIKVCEEICESAKIVNNQKMSCDIQNAKTATTKCPVWISATHMLNNVTVHFSIPFESSGLPSGPTHQSTVVEDANANRTAITIGCIVGGVIVLTLLALLIYFQRKKSSPKGSPNIRDGSSVGFRLPSQLPVEMVWPRQLSHEYNHRPDGYPNRNGVFRAQDGSEIPYTQLPAFVPEEIRINTETLEFTPDDIIGEGHFGVVYKGMYLPNGSTMPIEVAVKTLQVHTGNMNVRQFLSEGLLMKDFDNPYVLSLVGIAFADGWLPLIITPFMPNGNLLGYLRDPKNSPNLRQLLKFAIEIAEGMQYLEKQKFVHRDLAARNCMLDGDLHIRIADFGLSRDVYESGLYTKNDPNGELPIKWMPPESICNGVYNDKTDVWSFGIVLWEIMTRGQIPYTNPFVNNLELLSFIRDGNRLPKPLFCPDVLYAVMTSCWLMNPARRPNFSQLCMRIPAVVKSLESKVSGSNMDQPYINLVEREYLVPNSQRHSVDKNLVVTPFSHPRNSSLSEPENVAESAKPTIFQRFSNDSGGSTTELLSRPQSVKYQKNNEAVEDLLTTV